MPKHHPMDTLHHHLDKAAGHAAEVAAHADKAVAEHSARPADERQNSGRETLSTDGR